MKITNNVTQNVQADQDYTKKLQKKTNTNSQENNAGNGIEVSLSTESSNLLTYQELQCAIENIAASQSSIISIEQAEEMISRANKNILDNSNEAVLAQANQSAPSVAELTK